MRRLEDMTDEDLMRMLTWHVRRGDTIGDMQRAQEAQDEIWRRFRWPDSDQPAETDETPAAWRQFGIPEKPLEIAQDAGVTSSAYDRTAPEDVRRASRSLTKKVG